MSSSLSPQVLALPNLIKHLVVLHTSNTSKTTVPLSPTFASFVLGAHARELCIFSPTQNDKEYANQMQIQCHSLNYFRLVARTCAAFPAEQTTFDPCARRLRQSSWRATDVSFVTVYDINSAIGEGSAHCDKSGGKSCVTRLKSLVE